MLKDHCHALLPRFKKKLVQQDLSPVTIRGYLHDVNHFLRWLKEIYDGQEINIKKITTADLKAYRQYMVNMKRQKSASVNRRLQSLKRFFAWAHQNKWTKKNPAADVRFKRRMPLSKPTALNKSEVHALLRVAGQSPHGLAQRNYALIQLLLQAGLRIGEAATLQYQDVELQPRSGKVRISNGKGFKEREVPLNATARRALTDYLKTRELIQPRRSTFFNKTRNPADYSRTPNDRDQSGSAC